MPITAIDVAKAVCEGIAGLLVMFALGFGAALFVLFIVGVLWVLSGQANALWWSSAIGFFLVIILPCFIFYVYEYKKGGLTIKGCERARDEPAEEAAAAEEDPLLPENDFQPTGTAGEPSWSTPGGP
mmetsp:Transcript_19545/g.75035  ORF Transcript_19545/g.75035 Transcript_19545/m.75035 type:complete len:127 (+) Transcript_19545:111-491(+)